MNYEFLTIEDAQKIADNNLTEQKAVETLNKIQDRAMLTQLEVDLSNLCIKYRNMIRKAIEYMENYIKVEDAQINERIKKEFKCVIEILEGEDNGKYNN